MSQVGRWLLLFTLIYFMFYDFVIFIFIFIFLHFYLSHLSHIIYIVICNCNKTLYILFSVTGWVTSYLILGLNNNKKILVPREVESGTTWNISPKVQPLTFNFCVVGRTTRGLPSPMSVCTQLLNCSEQDIQTVS